VAKGLYGDEDADRSFKLAGGDFSDARVQAEVVIWRGRFNNTFTESDERKVFVHLLAKFVKSFNFLSCFFEYPDTTARFAAFAGFIGPQLIKLGSVSDLMKQIRQVELSKATVKFRGVKDLASQTVKTRSGGGSGNSQPPPKISLSDMIEKLRERFAISDNEALVIKEVCQEKMADPAIASSIQRHANDGAYLWDFYKPQLRRSITESYEDRGLYEAFEDPKYTDDGSIFDTMAFVVIQSGLEVRAP
jgi:type I restriction enzyme R subunit